MNGGGATSYQYDRSGLKTKVNYPNGTQALQSYDRAMRVSTIENKQNSAIVSAYQYQYDLNGNRTRQLETNGGTAETTTYEFDGNDRLTTVAYPDKTTEYSYDAAYNRLSERSQDIANQALLEDKSYRYNSRNQLTAITDHQQSVQSVSYSFDANGNQTIKSKNGSTTTFLYDVRDQLVSVQENATTLGMFYYDYQGMRVGKDMGGQIVHYTYDGKSVLTQSDVDGQTVAKYEYGPDQLLSLLHASEGRQFYLFDALGSVSNLTNTSGLVQARYQYDAFGNLRAEAGSSFNRFTFTGHEKDTETGLYYFKARFYDPDTGRFLNQDPYLGDVNTPPSLHRYLYAYSNPVVWVDLTGYASVMYRDDMESVFTNAEKGRSLRIKSDAMNAMIDSQGLGKYVEEVYEGENWGVNGERYLNAEGVRAMAKLLPQDASALLIVEADDKPNDIEKRFMKAVGDYGSVTDRGVANDIANNVKAGDVVDISSTYERNVREILDTLKIGKYAANAREKIGDDLGVLANSGPVSGGLAVLDALASAENAGKYGVDSINPWGKRLPEGLLAKARVDLGLTALSVVPAARALRPVAGEARAVGLATRRAYLNDKFGQSGDLNRDINYRGVVEQIYGNAGKAAEFAAGTPRTYGRFGTKAHGEFERLNELTNQRITGTDYSIVPEQFRGPSIGGGPGLVTTRRAAGSMGIDALIQYRNVPQIGFDLKTGRGWNPATLTEIQQRFGVPVEQIYTK